MLLRDYVQRHTQRGACTCGRCADAPENPSEKQPVGHTCDMFFFEVAAKGEPDAETLRKLLQGHTGVHCDCDPLDGSEHSYMEVGGWIGDQGAALQLMGLGVLLDLWNVLTPRMLPGLPDSLMQMMAGQGMVSIVPASADRAARTAQHAITGV